MSASTRPTTYQGKTVVLWTPEAAAEFMRREQAFVDAHQAGDGSGHAFDDGSVYVDADGGFVSAQYGLPVGGSVLSPDLEPATLPVSVSTNTGTITTGGEHETTHVAASVESVSEFTRLLNEVEAIPAHIRAFWNAHFGKHAA